MEGLAMGLDVLKEESTYIEVSETVIAKNEDTSNTGFPADTKDDIKYEITDEDFSKTIFQQIKLNDIDLLIDKKDIVKYQTTPNEQAGMTVKKEKNDSDVPTDVKGAEHGQTGSQRKPPLNCQKCLKSFNFSNVFVHHCVEEHQMNINDAQPFVCDRYPSRFVPTLGLQEHIQSHAEKNYKCGNCDEVYKEVKDMKNEYSSGPSLSPHTSSNIAVSEIVTDRFLEGETSATNSTLYNKIITPSLVKSTRNSKEHPVDVRDSLLVTINDRLQSLSQSRDEDTIFGEYVAIKLRYLRNYQRIIAEKLINDILFEAELNNLNTNWKVVEMTETSDINNFSKMPCNVKKSQNEHYSTPHNATEIFHVGGNIF